MWAGRLSFITGEFGLERIPVPEPGPGEVRVRVRAAGVCMSDVHLIETGMRLPGPGPDVVTLGHEAAGIIDSLGPSVSGIEVGQRVIVSAGKVVGGEVETLGLDCDGGWAEYLVTRANAVVPIPDSLPFEQAAIIPDAVSNPWEALTRTGKIRAGEAVGVWGVGGLGIHGVQLLRFAGAAPIIAVDPLPAARARALERGADLAFAPGDAAMADQVRALNGGRLLDAAIDFAGVGSARIEALSCLAVGGRLILIGISGTPVILPPDVLFEAMHAQLLGHYGYEDGTIAQLVKLIGLGRLDFSGSVTRTYPLGEAVQAVHDLAGKTGDPVRLVLIP